MVKTLSYVDVLACQASIAAVGLDSVRPVPNVGRRASRKELAAAARALFKRLAIRGVSVTAPNYSMAQAVDVAVPCRDDYTVRDPDGSVDWPNDPAARANVAARDKVEQILLRAFPGTEDRSDSRTDYFDYRWSIQSR